MKRWLHFVSAFVFTFFVFQNVILAQSTSCESPILTKLGLVSQTDKDSITFFKYTATIDGEIVLDFCNVSPNSVYPYVPEIYLNDCKTPYHDWGMDQCTNGQSKFKIRNTQKGNMYIFGVQNYDYQNKIAVAIDWNLIEKVPTPIADIYSQMYNKNFVNNAISFSNYSYNIDFEKTVWNFGDGTVITDGSTTLTHVYSNAGSYKVIATVQNSIGDTATDTLEIVVIDPYKNAIPAVLGNNKYDATSQVIMDGGQFYSYKTSSMVGQFTVDFCGAIDTNNYNLNVYVKNNGIINEVYPYSSICSGNNNTKYSFEIPSNTEFLLFVSVSDKAQLTQQITFEWQFSQELLKPVASIGYGGSSTILLGNEVYISNYSDYYETCLLDFGDGTKINSCQSEFHTYNKVGKYSITLTVFNGTNSDIDTIDITVVDPFANVKTANIGKNDVDTTILKQGYGMYYTYTSKSDCKLVVSMCNVDPLYSAFLERVITADKKNTIYTYTTNCTNSNRNYVFPVKAGETVYLVVNSEVRNKLITWSLNEEPYAPGEVCASAIKALVGKNAYSSKVNESSKKYYSFTPTTRSKVIISLCGLSDSVNASISDVSYNCQINGIEIVQYNTNTCKNGNSIYILDAFANKTIFFAVSAYNKTSNLPVSFDYIIEEIPYKEGELCEKPLKAIEGVNVFVPSTQYSATGGMQSQTYYSYTSKIKGRVIISLCNVPDTISAYIGPISNVMCSMTQGGGTTTTNNKQFTLAMCGSHHKYTLECEAGETIYFSLSGSQTLEWTLQEMAIPQGEECSNPIVAKKGTNIANWQFKPSAWFVYTAPANGAITVSNCDKTTENTAVLITSGCSMQIIGYNNDSCATQSQKTIQVESGKQYYIYWFKEGGENEPHAFLNEPTAFEWILEFRQGVVLPEGSSCAKPIVVQKVNTITSVPGGIVWYSYTATADSKVAISLNKSDLINSNLNLDVKSFKNCMASKDDIELNLIFEDTSAYFYAVKGETIQLAFMFGNNGSVEPIKFDWYLTEMNQTIPVSANCVYAKKVKIGSYTVPSTSVREWYTFTAPANGALWIKYKWDKEYLDKNIFAIMDKCEGQIVQTSDFEGKIIKPVKNGESVIIVCNNREKATIQWDLLFVPNNDVYIKDAFVLSNNNQSVMTTKAIIDTTKKTVLIMVGSTVDVNQDLYLTLKTLPEVKITLPTGKNYYDGMPINFKEPLKVDVISRDGSRTATWTISVEKEIVLHAIAKVLAFNVNNVSAVALNDSTYQCVLDWTTNTMYSMPYIISPDTMVSMQQVKGSYYSFAGYVNYMSLPDTSIIRTISEDGKNSKIYYLIVAKEKTPMGGDCEVAFSLKQGDNFIANNKSKNVWLQYTAEIDGFAKLDYASTGWANIEEKTGINCQNLNWVNNSDLNSNQPYLFKLTKGTQYYFRVSSDLMQFKLTLSETQARTAKNIEAIKSQYAILNTFIDAANGVVTLEIPYSKDTTIYGDVRVSDGASFTYAGSNSTYVLLKVGENLAQVIAEDGSTKKWIINVKMAVASTVADILAFNIAEQLENAVIDLVNKKIVIKVKSNTNITSLNPYFILSKGAKASVNGIAQISGISKLDFTKPVIYLVVAEDEKTIQKWEVSVSGAVVDIPVDKISLLNTIYSLYEGESVTIYASISPTNATNKTLSWLVNNSQVAVVSNVCASCTNATITGLSAGTTILNVTSSNGITTFASIVVNKKQIAVTSVQCSPKSANLVVGDKLQCIATILPVDATNKSVSWKTISTNISCDQSGVVMANSAGNAVVYAISLENKNILDSCVISVTNKIVPLTAVDIIPTELKTTVNSVVQLQAVYTPTNVSSSDVEWGSDDPTIATVNSKGEITTTSKTGTTKVWVRSVSNPKIIDAVIITNEIIPVTSIKLSAVQIAVEVGRSAEIYVKELLPQNATMPGCNWSIEGSATTGQTVKIEKQYAMGCVISGLLVGKALLVATSFDGLVKAQCYVEVIPIKVQSVTVSPVIVNTFVGDNAFTISANVLPIDAFDKSVKITNTSKNTITSITSSGSIIPIAVGIDTIIVTSVSNPLAVAKSVVIVSKSEIPVTGIQFIEESTSLLTGSTYQLLYEVSPKNATNKEVVFASSDVSIATVSNTGIVSTSNVIGKAMIFVYAATNKTIGDTIVIYNNPIKVETVKLDNQNVTLTVGAETKVNAYVYPSSATTSIVAWKVIDVNGIISTQTSGNTIYIIAKAKGTATIVASVGNVSDTCKVVVEPIVIQSIGLNVASLTLMQGDVKTITATIAPVNAENTKLLWSSSDTSIAKVDSKGTITAIAQGTTMINVSSEANPAIKVSCLLTVTSSVVALTKLAIVESDMQTVLDNINVDALSKKQLYISYLPTNATYKEIEWSSSSTTTKIDATGILITGNVEEVVVITAKSVKYPTISTSIKVAVVNVKPIQVQSIYVEPQVLVNISESKILKREILPIDATSKLLNWYSSNPEIVIVDKNGTITGINPGFAYVYAQANDYSAVKSNMCFVTVNKVAVTSIDININGVYKMKENSIDKSLSVTILPANATNKKIVWATQNSSVAIVDTMGTLIALKTGVAKIYAISVDNPIVRDSFVVEVVRPSADKLALGLLLDEAKSKLTFINDNNLAGIKAGQYPLVAIEAFTNTTLKAKVIYELNVATQYQVDSAYAGLKEAFVILENSKNQFVAISKVSIIRDTIVVPITEMNSLVKAYILPENASVKTVKWNSSNVSVVGVSEVGLLQPRAAGIATVYAYATDNSGKYDSVIVIVQSLVQQIIVPSTISTVVNNSVIVPYSILPNNATNQSLIWTVSDTSIAESKGNVIYGKKPGYAKVIVSTKDKTISAVSVLAVTQELIPVTGIYCQPSLSLIVGQKQSVKATVMPQNASNQSIIWKVANEAVATVFENGIVVANSVGKTELYAISDDGGFIDTTIVDVLASNPPVVYDIPERNVLVGTQSISIDLAKFISDDNTSIDNLKIQVSSLKGFTYTIDNQILTLIPNANYSGTEKVVISVTDRDGQTVTLTATVSVTSAVNKAPEVLAIPGQQIKSGDVFMPLYLDKYVIDDYTEASEIVWNIVSTKNISGFVSNGVAKIIVLDNTFEGVDTLIFEAKDKDGLIGKRKVAFAVSKAVNKAPVIDAIPTQVQNESTLFSYIDLKQYVKDDYSSSEAIRWVASASTKLNITIINGLSYIAVIDQNWLGTETITFTATDDDGLQTSVKVLFSQELNLSSSWPTKPLINFYADNNVVGVDEMVSFHASLTGAKSWIWEFEGGSTPNLSKTNPDVVYSKPGNYTVKLLAQNTYGIDSLVIEKYISVVGIEEENITICKGDNADIHVSNSLLTSYKWSTGETTPSIKVSPSTTTTYSVTATNGLFKYYDNVIVTAKQPVNLGKDVAICEGGSVTIKPVVSAETSFESYIWNDNSKLASIQVTTTGTYSVTTVDDFGCKTSDDVIVTVNPLPKVSLGVNDSICPNAPKTLDAGAGFSYVWSSGETTQTIKASKTDNFAVTVTNSLGCSNADTVSIVVKQPFEEELGVATVLGKNKIVLAWNKHANKNTKLYTVLRETTSANVWDIVGTRAANDTSYIVDYKVDALQQTYRYKLQTTDNCGSKSESKPHRTMLLQAVYSESTKANQLAWNGYEGVALSTYNIYRNGVKIESIAASSTNGEYKFNDTKGVSGDTYYIGYDLPIVVNTLLTKADSGPYSQSLSNMAESELTNISINELNAIVNAFPNPADKALNVTISSEKASAYTVSLNDIVGQQLQVYVTTVTDNITIEIPTDGLNNGMYVLKIVADGTIITKQIIVNR